MEFQRSLGYAAYSTLGALWPFATNRNAKRSQESISFHLSLQYIIIGSLHKSLFQRKSIIFILNGNSLMIL
jgi:hypothetical protein